MGYEKFQKSLKHLELQFDNYRRLEDRDNLTDLDREAIAESVEEELEPLGFPRDKRGFNPHLTVARMRDGASAEDRQQAAEVLHGSPRDSTIEIDVNAVSLMRSTLRSRGATYDCLVSIPLSEGYRKERKT